MLIRKLHQRVACLLATFLLAIAFTACGDNNTGFNFVIQPASAYTRVDRMGMPAINTAVITNKNAYNQASPANDINGDFVAEITANVTSLHTALDDDLQGAGLTPASPALAVNQAGPLIIPDTLRINPAQPPGFPNGRRLADPVIDLTLAVVLLDLAVHDVTTLANLPLNPPANDLAFPAAFPFLAPAQ